MRDREIERDEYAEQLVKRLLAGETVEIDGREYTHSEVVLEIWEDDVPAIDITDRALRLIENDECAVAFQLLKDVMKGRTAKFVESKLGIIK